MTLLQQLEAAGEGSDNALDVLIEIALFEPDEDYTAVRANSAGTKVIYTRADGSFETCWARDWTMARHRENTMTALRARSAGEGE